MIKVNGCEHRCEKCECVDRGFDEYSHQVHWISDRCPLNEIVKMYREINGHFLPMELITGYTGCIHFKEDLEHKRIEEESNRLIEEMHKRWKDENND